MDIIRVSNDGWNFEERTTGKRIVPFGSNFVFDYPKTTDKNDTMRSFDILVDEVFRTEEIEKAFADKETSRVMVLSADAGSDRFDTMKKLASEVVSLWRQGTGVLCLGGVGFALDIKNEILKLING